MGAQSSKEAFFTAAQTAGIIEFIHPSGKRHFPYPPEIEKLAHAIKILRGYVQEPQDQKRDTDNAEAYATSIIELKEKKSKAEEERRAVQQELERILPFGDFSFEEIKKIEEETGRKIRFFCAKNSKHLDEIENSLILINRGEGIDYFIAYQNEPLIHADLFEMHFTESLTALERRLHELNVQIEASDAELKGYTRLNWYLHLALIQRMNEANLLHAQDCSSIELETQLFFAEGWVPAKEKTAVQALAKQYDIYCEQVAPDHNEEAPTCLENKGVGKVGEDLVRIFDIPSNKDKDPSLWVLFAFSLFFSMIVYDGGYGLIFLVTALYLHFKMKNKTHTAKRFIMLMATLSISCTLWGGLTHSYFGIELSPDNVFRKHSLMTWLVEKKAAFHISKKDQVFESYQKRYPQMGPNPSVSEFLYAHNPNDASETPIADKFTDSILMELVLFIGSIHLCMGLIRYLRFNPVGAGWVAFIIGAYLYLPYYLATTSLLEFVFGIPQAKGADFGLQLLCFGIGLALVIGVIRHGFLGLFEFMHSIQIFADVLSYLRIYALGTAGFIVSATVNHFAATAPLLVAIGLAIGGHLLNILLAIMGGTIHGLRLNFLEWYRYSFYGGGKEFLPLRLQTFE